MIYRGYTDQNYVRYFTVLFKCAILEMRGVGHLLQPFITAALKLIKEKASACPRFHKNFCLLSYNYSLLS